METVGVLGTGMMGAGLSPATDRLQALERAQLHVRDGLDRKTGGGFYDY